MKCPLCEEGTINQVTFKRTQQVAFLCDECDNVWFEGEKINKHTK